MPQSSPVYPCTHSHIYEPSVFLQVAPFRQGVDRHSFISEINKKNNYWFKIQIYSMNKLMIMLFDPSTPSYAISVLGKVLDTVDVSIRFKIPSAMRKHSSSEICLHYYRQTKDTSIVEKNWNFYSQF